MVTTERDAASRSLVVLTRDLLGGAALDRQSSLGGVHVNDRIVGNLMAEYH